MAKRLSCYVDGENEEMVCDRCGCRLPVPLGDIRWVAGVLEAFERAHEGCSPGNPGRTQFAAYKGPWEPIHEE